MPTIAQKQSPLARYEGDVDYIRAPQPPSAPPMPPRNYDDVGVYDLNDGTVVIGHRIKKSELEENLKK